MNTSNKAKFAYPLAIKGDEKELRDLIPKLEQLGYIFDNSFSAKDCPYLFTNFGCQNDSIGFNQSGDGQYIVPASNSQLVLALAAMREGNEFHVGESVILDSQEIGARAWDDLMGGNRFYTILKADSEFVYTKEHPPKRPDSNSNYYTKSFRKATKEEIIARYTKKEKNSFNFATNGSKIDMHVYSNNTFTTQTPNSMNTKKIKGYKLIKEYPGSGIRGNYVDILKSPVKAVECAKFSEFWQPIYAEEITMIYNLPGVGKVIFDKSRKGIFIGSEVGEYISNDEIHCRMAVLQSDRTVTHRMPSYSYGTDDTWVFEIVTVRIGCRHVIKVTDLKDMFNAYKRFINSTE